MKIKKLLGQITQAQSDQILTAIKNNQTICDGTGNGMGRGRGIGGGFGNGCRLGVNP